MTTKAYLITILRARVAAHAESAGRLKRCSHKDDAEHVRAVLRHLRVIRLYKKVIDALRHSPESGCLALAFVSLRVVCSEASRERRKQREKKRRNRNQHEFKHR